MAWPIPALPVFASPRQPGLRAWAILFPLIMACGAGLVLMLWPRAVSTQSLLFWLILIGAPLCVFMVLLGMRLFAFASDCEQLAVLDQERSRILSLWDRWARKAIRVAVVNVWTPDAISPAHWMEDVGALPVQMGRSLEFDWPETVEETRQKLLFDRVLDRFSPSLLSIPRSSSIEVHCFFAPFTKTDTPAIELAWEASYGAFKKKSALLKIGTFQVHPLLDVAECINAAFDQASSNYRLFVIGQFADTQAESCSEGAMAFLAAPNDHGPMHNRPGPQIIAEWLRPMPSKTADFSADMAAMIAVQAAQAKIRGAWHSGLDEDAQAGFLTALGTCPVDADAASEKLRVHALDDTLGLPGVASGLFALGFATQVAVEGSGPQLVAQPLVDDASAAVAMQIVLPVN